ncbi:MAG TPA: hypothetical protein VKB60_10835 [Terriglobales bacterium]|nr:hypothetical protein [Terriglobales bacterium]
MRLFKTHLVVFSLLLVSAAAWSQRTNSSPRSGVSTNTEAQTAPWAPTAADLKFHKLPVKPGESLEDKQLQEAEKEKALLKQDAARLLKLIGEIKDDLDDSPAGTVGSDDLKKTEEIEKLAKKLHKSFQSETK